jgi:ABC-2 type transport system permease protein
VKHPIFTMVSKELIHIIRDRQSLFMVLSMPLIMLLLYGYAITMDMKAIDLVVTDAAMNVESREVIRRLNATDFFRIRVVPGAPADAGEFFQKREAQCVLVIPRDFGASAVCAGTDELQLLIDASDPNAANFMQTYVTGALAPADAEGPALFTVSPRIFYNPDMRSAAFFIPGLIALILLLISALLTSIAIVREKETGTMEQLLVSPVKPFHIIIGKVLPYTALGFFDGMVILVVGSLLFSVPVTGSVLLVMLMMLVYVVTGLSLGMLVSTVSKSQSVAMIAAIIMTVLPSMLMSGFIFPISSMPPVFQAVSRIVPATYFIEIIRGIILKGNTLANLYRPAGVLLGMDLLLIALSIRAFRIRLE